MEGIMERRDGRDGRYGEEGGGMGGMGIGSEDVANSLSVMKSSTNSLWCSISKSRNQLKSEIFSEDKLSRSPPPCGRTTLPTIPKFQLKNDIITVYNPRFPAPS
jgi:hypothetical protein